MGSHQPPRTWGETVRRHGACCQRLLGMAKNPTHSEEQRQYYGALAHEALLLLHEAEYQPADAPAPSRRAAMCCDHYSCGRTVWVSARAAWEDREAGRWAAAAEHLCHEHQLPGGYQEPPLPLTDAEREELAQLDLDRLVWLDRELFAEQWDSPRMLARATTGLLDRLIHRWRIAGQGVVSLLGPEMAPGRIAEARAAAGTDALMRATFAALDEREAADREQNPPSADHDPLIGEHEPPIGEHEPGPAVQSEPEPEPEPEDPAPSELDGWIF